MNLDARGDWLDWLGSWFGHNQNNLPSIRQSNHLIMFWLAVIRTVTLNFTYYHQNEFRTLMEVSLHIEEHKT